MALRYVFDNGKSQAGAARFARTAFVYPIEAFCHAGEVLACNAGSGITYGDAQPPFCGWCGFHGNVAACRGIAHGIA